MFYPIYYFVRLLVTMDKCKLQACFSGIVQKYIDKMHSSMNIDRINEALNSSN